MYVGKGRGERDGIGGGGREEGGGDEGRGAYGGQWHHVNFTLRYGRGFSHAREAGWKPYDKDSVREAEAVEIFEFGGKKLMGDIGMELKVHNQLVRKVFPITETWGF